MSKKRTKMLAVVTALPVRLSLADQEIVPLQYFRVPERRPTGDGPWKHEPEKIGWRDATTDLPCIILRHPNGTLCGYVGVPISHPLFGFEASAIDAGIGINVHGGLNYASECQARVPEAVSICHVPASMPRHAQARYDSSHEAVWWFGFSTDHPGDFVPTRPVQSGVAGLEVYRDQHFVYREVVRLAGQLSAVADAPTPAPADETLQLPVWTPSNDGEEQDHG